MAEANVYGINVSGLPSTRWLAPPVAGAPSIAVRETPGSLPTGHILLTADRAEVALKDEPPHGLVMERGAGEATYLGPPLAHTDFAHPYLGPITTILHRWSGREVVHAGAFVADDVAWGITAASQGGKSTVLAAIAGAGYRIVADDLVVTDGSQVLAGPRCLDLRHPPDAALAARFEVTKVRCDARWRLTLPAEAPALPLGGWVFLEWGNGSPQVRRLRPSELVGRLAQSRQFPSLPSDPQVLLAMAAAPAWELTRPRSFDSLAATVTLLIDALRRRSADRAG
ncbi:MAG TPA: hypothetical protein VG708_10830 [Mycobacteriales bacterium]|nr:hypothetical protein [Mycobacteriales bacterium]